MSLSERKQLSTGWSVKATHLQDGPWLPVKHVPTEIHLDLLDNGKIAEPFADLNELSARWVAEQAWTYRTTFTVTEATFVQYSSIDVIFEGLDTFATVVLNGREILKSDNMFLAHRVDVRNILNVSNAAENTLEITFESARKRGLQLVTEHPEHRFIVHQTEISRAPVRKAQYHWGWDWGPIFITCGPWKPIWLHSYTVSIDEIWVEYDLSETLRHVDVRVYAQVIGKCPDTLVCDLLLEDEKKAEGEMRKMSNEADKGRLQVSFRLENPMLWWPRGYGEQILYQLVVRTQDSQARSISGEVKSKMIGFRRTQLVQEADEYGTSFYFRINNVDVFCGGSCWIPADSFVSRIMPERYREWVKLAAEGNQIMIRIWGGGIYEANALYDVCDEMGVLVWQDFMFACANYPAYPAFLESVEAEATYQVRRLRHHPSIVIWAGNNEDYQIMERYGLEYLFKEDKDPQSWLKTNFPARYIYEYLLPKVVNTELPGAIYHPSSPWGNGTSTVQQVDPTVGDIHQWNVWHGTMEPYQKLPEMGGRFVSEFGMEGYPHMSTLKTFTTNRSELCPGSLIMEHHNKAIGHNRRIASYMSENYSVTPVHNLEAFTRLSQLTQADALSIAYRSWRRQWQKQGVRKCGGVLVWQFNDCWPTISWAVVDYHLVPKPAYYAIKRALEPITVNVQRKFHNWTVKPAESGLWHRDTSHIDPRPLFQDVTFDVWIASSQLDSTEIILTVRYISVASGKDVQKRHLSKIAVEPNGTTEALPNVKGPNAYTGDSNPDMPIDTAKLNPYIIYASIALASEPDTVIAEDVSWPEPIKYLRLGDPEVRLEYDQKQGSSVIALEAERPVKGLIFAERPGISFSDNGFDLIPGVRKAVTVRGLQDTEDLRWSCVGA